MGTEQLAGKKIAVALGRSLHQNFSVKIQHYTSDTLTVEYDGIPGNAPETYNNFVALWAGSMINLDIPPLKKQFIDTNLQPGTVVLNELEITGSSYIVAYGVGKELTTICANALLSAGGSALPNHVNIGLNNVTSKSISLNYQTLPGYLPKKYNNWVALWEGYALPYTASKPLAQVPVPSNASQEDVSIKGVHIKTNTEYTLVYFVGRGGKKIKKIWHFTEAAALMYFNTGDYIKG